MPKIKGKILKILTFLCIHGNIKLIAGSFVQKITKEKGDGG